ncbi:MAG TPA: hypothetical protein PKK26_04855 [Candidatus Wallbacteria bacterium]|nr:hypothetical protein [Candidatus Wallbacteria bacterium]
MKRKKSFLVYYILIIFLFSPLFSSARAINYDYNDFIFKTIGESCGLTAKNITCLAYDAKDKLLFIGTGGEGVFVFDGRRATPLLTAPKIPSDSVLSMIYIDSHDILAIGTNSGLTLLSRPGQGCMGEIKTFTTREHNMPAGAVFSLCADERDVYAGTDTGFFVVSSHSSIGATVTKFSQGVDCGRVNSIFINREKILFFGTETGVFKTADLHNFEEVKFMGEPFKSVTRISEFSNPKHPENKSGKGTDIAILSIEGLYILYADGRTKHLAKDDGLPENWLTCFEFDRMEIPPAFIMNISKTPNNAAQLAGLLTMKVPGVSFKQSKDGVAIVTASVEKLFNNETFKTAAAELGITQAEFKADEGLLKATTFTDPFDFGPGLFIGTKNSGLSLYNGDKFITFNTDNSPLISNAINAVLSTKSYIYAATGGGLFRYERHEAVMEGKPIETIFLGKVNTIKAIGDDLYIGDYQGLRRYRAGMEIPVKMSGDMDDANVNTIASDDTGNVIIGTQHSGILIFKDGGIVKITKDGGLPSNNCTSLARLKGRGTIAGFGDAHGPVSSRCAIIGTDLAVSKFEPLENDSLTTYDVTSSEGRAPVTAILPVKEGFYLGLGFGDPKSLAYFDGSQWSYPEIPEAAFENVNSITLISGTGEICVCGKIVADHGGALRIRDNGRQVVTRFGNANIKLLETAASMADSSSDGIWMLRKIYTYDKLDYCSVAYEGNGISKELILKGYGIAMDQIGPYIFAATQCGVIKILKSHIISRKQ